MASGRALPVCGREIPSPAPWAFLSTLSGERRVMEMVKENKVDILGPPQSSAPVATTVVTIQTETAVPDHIVWSLFNTIFMNWCCLGPAQASWPSDDKPWDGGDMTGARTYASTAKCLNVWALVLGLVLTIVSIVLLVNAYVAAYSRVLKLSQESSGYH
uniref:Interferon induced transmembrane protein 1 n=1 Tax=Ursus americanus TaxID=9643 RepID=A0A452RWM7_URSAM